MRLRSACPVLLLELLSLGACAAPKHTAGVVEAFTLSDLVTQLAEPLPPASIALFKRIPVAQYYQTLLANTTDEPFTLAGRQLNGVHARLAGAAAHFARLAESYDSWGAQAAANAELNVAPGRSYTAEAYAAMADFYLSRSGPYAAVEDQATPLVEFRRQRRVAVTVTPEAQSWRNVAAAAALAVVGESVAHTELGLVTNARRGDVCAGLSELNNIEFQNNGQPDSCTGAFFKGTASHDYLLTAGHCTTSNTSAWTTTDPNGNVVSGKAVHQDNYKAAPVTKAQYDALSQYDIGIIAFPPGTAAGYAQIATSPVSAGTQVTVAGFGDNTLRSSFNGAGALRCGVNTVLPTSAEQATIALSGFVDSSSAGDPVGVGSLPGPGDSGSPMIVNQNGHDVIVGVDSNATLVPDDVDTTTANYADVTTVSNQQFISVNSQ